MVSWATWFIVTILKKQRKGTGQKNNDGDYSAVSYNPYNPSSFAVFRFPSGAFMLPELHAA